MKRNSLIQLYNNNELKYVLKSYRSNQLSQNTFYQLKKKLERIVRFLQTVQISSITMKKYSDLLRLFKRYRISAF